MAFAREAKMVIEAGEQVHVIYRPIFEGSVRRHFLGEVTACDGAVCRLDGYAFVYNSKVTTFERKPDKRITFIDLAESGYIVNIVGQGVVLDEVIYKYVSGVGLVATDEKAFLLDVNEFSVRN
jgi:hypothetical protein